MRSKFTVNGRCSNERLHNAPPLPTSSYRGNVQHQPGGRRLLRDVAAAAGGVVVGVVGDHAEEGGADVEADQQGDHHRQLHDDGDDEPKRGKKPGCGRNRTVKEK